MKQPRIPLSALGRLILLAAPLIVGIPGFLLDGNILFSDALFHCVSMYMLNYQDSPPNFYVELARWAAPLATASGVFMAVSAVRNRLRGRVRYLLGNSVAVYGPEPEQRELLAQLGRRGICGGERFVRAHRYILLHDEKWNLEFYHCHRAEAERSAFYLKCPSLSAQSVADPMLHVFCPEELAACLFWRTRPMYETSVSCGHRMRFVFLGFGRLGEELLTRALLNNIFDPGQCIEYHIFGDGRAFCGVHTQLSSISDPVVFHREPWYDQLDLLEEAQLVIVLTQEGQLSLLKDLLLATRRAWTDVFAADSSYEAPLAGQQRLRLFAWKRDTQSLDNIFHDSLFEQAQELNLRYTAAAAGRSPEAYSREEEWRKLDAFTRCSNISAADFGQVCREILSGMRRRNPGQPESERLELLARLEHIRWCRFHYLNNWTFGYPEQGGRKDSMRRVHSDLRPYDSLPEEEREKDREGVRTLLPLG